MTPLPSEETFDLLIIGAGPAGISAALAAAPSGARIAVIDDNPLPGGQIWRDGPAARLPARALQLRARLQACANVVVYGDTRVIALSGTQQLLLENAERGWHLRYGQLILCTGARERLLPFPGWTLPGVTGAGGLQALCKGGVPLTGERLVVAGSGPLLLASAATARKAGAQLLRVAEQAPRHSIAHFALGLWAWPAKAVQAAVLLNRHYRTNSHVLEAFGDGQLQGVRMSIAGRVEEIACDRLAVGFGLVPNVQIGQAMGCALASQAIAVDTWQAASVPGHYAAGECTGFGGSELACIEGTIAGLAATGQADEARSLWPQRQHWQSFADSLERTFSLQPALKSLARDDTLICRCEDVTLRQLRQQPGWTAAKMSSRCGMGACQGRVCGTATQFMFGWDAPAPRPPFVPARVSTLALLAKP